MYIYTYATAPQSISSEMGANFSSVGRSSSSLSLSLYIYIYMHIYVHIYMYIHIDHGSLIDPVRNGREFLRGKLLLLLLLLLLLRLGLYLFPLRPGRLLLCLLKGFRG